LIIDAQPLPPMSEMEELLPLVEPNSAELQHREAFLIQAVLFEKQAELKRVEEELIKTEIQAENLKKKIPSPPKAESAILEESILSALTDDSPPTLNSQQEILELCKQLSDNSQNLFATSQAAYLKSLSSTIIPLKFSWGGLGYLPADTIQRKISLQIKSFYGPRQKLTLKVPIDYSIAQVISEFISKSSIKAKNIISSKLFYPMGTMKELNL
jgi:hypothetical protein